MNKKEIMKKVGSIVIASTIALTPTLTLAKTNNYTKANITQTKKDDEIKVYYNGEKIEFDQKPVLINDRTLVPFRKVFETMGCIVYYNNNEGKVMALTGKGDILIHKIGSNEFEFNKEVMTFDSASTILNDRTLIPLRAVAEILNSNVEWNEKNNTVTIEKQEEKLDDVEKEILTYILDINYNPKFTKRYVAYKKLHPEKSIKEVIEVVNYDGDKELTLVTGGGGVSCYAHLTHYEASKENIEPIEDLDDPYVYINKFRSVDKNWEASDIVKHTTYKGTNFQSKFKKEVIEALDKLLEAATPEVGYIEIDMGYMQDTYLDTVWTGGYQMARAMKVNAEAYIYETFPQPKFSELRTGYGITFYPANHSFREIELYEKNNGVQLDEDILRSIEKFYQDITPKKEWLKANAYKFGFIERYPEGKKDITRYEFSTNFYRYVGVDIAKQMHDENLCYDEYYAKYMNPVVNSNKYTIEHEAAQKVLMKY